jgi:hypothetical protein
MPSSQAKKVDPLQRLTWTRVQFYQSCTAFFDAKKHFSRWKEPARAPFIYAFAGDSEPTHALARWVGDFTMPHSNELYKSEMHGGHEINLNDFVLFCMEKIISDQLYST